MKSYVAIGFALALAIVVMGCAKDRAGCSGCSSTASTFNQNSTSYGSNSRSPVADSTNSSGINVIQHKLCPVTGERLDSMGGAIPVEANGRTIFVCCQGCVKSVKNDPGKYLAIARAE